MSFEIEKVKNKKNKKKERKGYITEKSQKGHQKVIKKSSKGSRG